MRICFSIIFILGVFQILSACDDPSPPGRPEPLTQDITLRGGEDGERKVHGADLKPGDCEALRLRTESLIGRETDSYDFEVLGEMYDRSICSPLDTKKAFEAFRKAGEAWGWDWHPVTAWKLWYGDGVERDREEAKRQFRDWVVALSVRRDVGRIKRTVRSTLRDRTLPPPLVEGIAWVNSIVMQDPYIRAGWAVDLYTGDAIYYDGSRIPPKPRTAYYQWLDVPDPIHYYHSGVAKWKVAENERDRRRALVDFQFAAHCSHRPSIKWLIEIYGNEDSDQYFEIEAHVWALIAAGLGMDVEETLRQQESEFDPEWLERGRELVPKKRWGPDLCE